MMAWWDNLTVVNQSFFSAAAFFTVFFVWQLIAALIGLDDQGADDVADGVDFEADVDADIDADASDFDAGADTDSAATVVAFKLVSIRAIITFCTLFTWGCALYLNDGVPMGKAMGISSMWGLAGMACIALLLSLLPKLAHTGTKRIATSLGAKGSVYLDIPAGGQGEVRVAVSDVISFVKARASGGGEIKAGTPVIIKRIIDQTTVEVEVATEKEEGGNE